MATQLQLCQEQAQRYLSRVEQRDKVELLGPIPRMTQNCFELQMEIIQVQKELNGGD